MMHRHGLVGWLAAALLATPVAFHPPPAAASWAPGTQTPDPHLDPGDPYQTTAIVTGFDMRSRPAGFAQCLREVLIKVSGEPRLRNDARLDNLAAHADELVASFHYLDEMAGIPPHDEQGTYDRPYDLTVHFDPARIDAALAKLGETPWRGDRPVVVPVLAVRAFNRRYLLDAENPRAVDQRAAFATAAAQYGVKLHIPTRAELAGWGAGADRLSEPPTPSANEVAVTGTLEFDEALPGWVGSWHMRWRGADYAWRIGGVNFDEAFRDLARGVLRVASGRDGPT